MKKTKRIAYETSQRECVLHRVAGTCRDSWGKDQESRAAAEANRPVVQRPQEQLFFKKGQGKWGRLYEKSDVISQQPALAGELRAGRTLRLPPSLVVLKFERRARLQNRWGGKRSARVPRGNEALL